ncbi:MAG: division/cell wall cluster transcriptional repressor MraZ [Deltaproteobacteria bacterium]|nr:division/cell wall cluster transcriptional repressor MraZ [Deltaproteobacteria bacterium]NCP02637.1 division/cell wall cluster transcriptional repressor MraZ [Deltaproteobacteria bacterium]
MMFQGEFNNTVDPKGRASIPTAFREALKDTGDEGALVVTKADGGLAAYPASVWQQICERVMALPPGPRREANLRTRIAPARECCFDRQGRIQIPQSLREYADLDKDIVVVGMIEKIEIWNQQRHAAATGESEALLRDDAQGQADLGF